MKEIHDIELGLSQWSFHRSILGSSRDDYENFLATLHSANSDLVLCGQMDSREIVDVAKLLGASYVDLVNILFFARVEDESWLLDFKEHAEQRDIEFNCLMCDELGSLGASSLEEREISILKHKKWINAADLLGCKMVRVNAYGDGTYLQQLKQNAESISILADYADQVDISIVVENHGHPSSNGAWLAMLIEQISMPNVGVYIDFDNFFMGGWNLSPKRFYDRYQGLLDLAPYTIGASAKSYQFNELGDETTVDFSECVGVLKSVGFKGVVSAEYEGDAHSELEGTGSTLALIKKFM